MSAASATTVTVPTRFGCSSEKRRAGVGKTTVTIDRSIPVRGWNRSELSASVQRAAVESHGYRPLAVSLDRATFARSVRPRWATVAAIVTAPTLIGLGFLAVRRSESFAVVAHEDHSGLDLRVHGRVDGALLSELSKMCAAGPAPVVVAAGTASVPSPVVGVPGLVAPPSAAAAPPLPTAIGVPVAAFTPPVPSAPPLPTAPPVVLGIPVAAGPSPAPSDSSGTSAPQAPSDQMPAPSVPSVPPLAPVPGGAPTPPPLHVATTLFGAAPSPRGHAAPSSLPVDLPAPGSEAADGATRVVNSARSGAGQCEASRSNSRTPLSLLTLRFEDGRIIDVSGTALIGRNPSADNDEQHVQLIAIPHDTVSKTHLSVGAHDGVAWVTDRHSTNGSAVIDENGIEVPLVPGQRTPVRVGCGVRLGAVWARIEALT